MLCGVVLDLLLFLVVVDGMCRLLEEEGGLVLESD